MDGALIEKRSTADQRIRALIGAAREARERGRPQEAIPLLRQAEMEAPRHPLVLNETAARMLANGNVAGALVLLEQAADAEPNSTEILFNLAAAFKRQDRIDEAAETLERLLVIDQRNLPALLEKAALEEQQCKPRAAAMSYRTALQLIPPGLKPPPGLAAQLAHAQQAVDDNGRALEAFVAEGLADLRARFKDETLSRFDQCVDTLLQKRRVWRQQPTFMFFPELPAIEFYERARFPFLDAVDAAFNDIRSELLAVMAEGDGVLDPYVAHPGGMPMEQWRELNMSRRWGVYSLWREGKAYPEHIARCPKTVKALQDVPRWDVPGNGPTALFSILDAKTRIPAHTGPVNTRLVVHLPLIVPPGCGFRVGGQQREWVPGKAFVFDDSINHEAWNDSDLPRAVLIFDIWSPYLSEAERELTRALTGRIGEWYGTRSNSKGI
jgi:aspartyl/asparaginyl beta-hydroxylase (cupin superfamily)